MKDKTWIYNSLEEIEDEIVKSDTRVISFDLFDTLVVRPVERCEDVFEMLDHFYANLSEAMISFAKLRIEAESVLRRRIINKELETEDIKLTDIYMVLQSEFGIPEYVCKKMLSHEMELELSILRPRKSGKRLFEKAIESGKRVVICSDMYLEKDHIKSILDANGYGGVEEIFVSSEAGLRKISGNLYTYMAKELGVKPEDILHIGDNEESDCRVASLNGLNAAYLPNTIKMYYSYGCGHQVEKICHDLTDWQVAGNSVGIGVMRQMAANKYFDDPFRLFCPESDYNMDPYFVGYGALGMELLALTRWIMDNIRVNNIDRMIFAARDGYLPMKAFEILRKYDDSIPVCEYAHISRRSLLSAIMLKKEDLYALPVDITYQTPAKLMVLLDFCHSASSEEYVKDGKILGLDKDENLTKDTFIRFIKAFNENYYSLEKHEKSIGKIKEYLTSGKEVRVTNTSAIFDMGYSGRIPAAIYKATGLSPRILFFHGDTRDSFRYQKKTGMKIDCFIDFKPYMESSMREYSYLEAAASCIGYDDDINPVFDIGPAPGYSDACEKMQRGALDFIADFMEFFSEFKDEVQFRNHDAAMPFEAFLRFCSEKDKEIYESVLIDDELWGGRRDINLKYLMNSRLSKIPEYAR